ncbi:MAG TPA: carbohydrate kinase, partial [Thermomicrobiales bacterium]|nr:carbohydrate kinase [Thermomicrobiales bacterium]
PRRVGCERGRPIRGLTVDPGASAPPTKSPVLSIGEILIDLIVSDGSANLEGASTFVARAGGAPANVAVALARLGVASAFCGVVGTDPFGKRLRTTLHNSRVDDSRLRSTNAADTTIAFAWKDERGDGHFRLLRMADRLLSPDDIDSASIAETAAIVVGSVALAANPSRAAIIRAGEIALAQNVPICFDVNLRPAMWSGPDAARVACGPIFSRATLLKFSLDDARYLFNEADDPDRALDHIVSFGAKYKVLTDGARGAWFVAKSAEPVHVPAFAVDAIEPTGAGDAFTAALVARLIGNGWLSLSREDVVYASAAGALTSMRRGAMDALPTASAVETFLATHAER